MSGECLEDVSKVGGCLEGVWRVSKGYLEGIGKISGRCLEDIQKVSGGNF